MVANLSIVQNKNPFSVRSSRRQNRLACESYMLTFWIAALLCYMFLEVFCSGQDCFVVKTGHVKRIRKYRHHSHRHHHWNSKSSWTTKVEETKYILFYIPFENRFPWGTDNFYSKPLMQSLTLMLQNIQNFFRLSQSQKLFSHKLHHIIK